MEQKRKKLVGPGTDEVKLEASELAKIKDDRERLVWPGIYDYA